MTKSKKYFINLGMLRNPFAFIIFLIILSLISLNHGLSASDTSSAQKEQCLICHDSFLKKSKKNIHSAFNIGCESCHIEAPGSSHPEKQYSIKLRYEIPALCFNCHEQSKFNGIDVHSPVAKGMCINCHDPHGSENHSLLVREAPDLCYQCHDKNNFAKKYIHGVASGGCNIRCHRPHASDYPHLLSSPVVEICGGCHAPQLSGRHIVTLSGGRVHPIAGVRDPKNPNDEMSCTSCHSPHSSDFPKLFTHKSMCKRCHKNF